MRYANDQLVTAMQWCAKHHDFSKSREAKQLLDARETMLEVIDELHQDAKVSAIETREALNKAQRQLAANPTWQHATDAADAQLRITTNRERCAAALRQAERALGVISTQSSHLLAGVEVAAELLPIIAAERCADVASCDKDAVSSETAMVWYSLRFDWHPRWQIDDDGLTLPHRLVSHANGSPSHHLPIIWSQWDNQRMRASLAWVWQQLAAGHFKIADMPTPKGSPKPAQPRKCIKLTADFDGQLPKVPKVPDVPRGSSFQVIGMSK